MKLCFLASANSIHSFKWIKFFAEKGHEICWISVKNNEFGELENTKFSLLKSFKIKIFNVLFNINSTKKIIKEFKPDVLHAHYVGINGVLAAFSGFHPFVLTVWGSDVLFAGKSKTKGMFVHYALKKADLVTCDADHMKKTMIELGVDSSKIKIVYFGIDTKRFAPGPKDETIAQQLHLGDAPVVISLRSLEPVYDLETLILAIPFVLKEVPETIFIIAGRGSKEEKLKNMVRDLKIEKNVKFIGFIANDCLPGYLRTADIYVSTSLSDAGISSCTAEAMACRLPVVITNTAENEKWVKNRENGCLIPVKNPKVLAEKIIYLLKNKNIRNKFGKINRKVIEEKNNYYKEMAKMEKIYQEMIKNNG